jgi:hypothetical protein
MLEYESGPGPFMRRLLILILVIAIGATSVAQPPTLTKHAMQVRKQVEALPVSARITVILNSGVREFGTFVSSDESRFTFRASDRPIDISENFNDVRQVQTGYRRPSDASGTGLSNRSKHIVGWAIVVGLIGGVIAAAASARN